MLGIFLLYYIGKQYYGLAQQHNKHKWGFAILGVVAYYVGAFLGGLVLGLLFVLLDWNIDSVPSIGWDLMALPIGALVCWGVYSYLKKRWINASPQMEQDILDAGI